MVANQRQAFSLYFTLALYISIGFGLRRVSIQKVRKQPYRDMEYGVNIFDFQPSKVKRWSFTTYVFLNSEVKLETYCEVSETIENGIKKSNFLRGKMFPK